MNPYHTDLCPICLKKLKKTSETEYGYQKDYQYYACPITNSKILKDVDIDEAHYLLSVNTQGTPFYSRIRIPDYQIFYDNLPEPTTSIFKLKEIVEEKIVPNGPSLEAQMVSHSYYAHILDIKGFFNIDFGNLKASKHRIDNLLIFL